MKKIFFLFSFFLLFGIAFAELPKSSFIGDTTVTIANKEIAIKPLDKNIEIIFEKITDTKYKYSLGFSTTENITSIISFDNQEPCISGIKQVVCGTTLYNFNDMNDYKIDLQISKNGFDLVILDLEKNKEYFIDPIIDANYMGISGSITVTYTSWFAQTFKALSTNQVPAISVPLYKVGSPDGNVYVEIHDTNGTFPNIKPTSMPNIACRGTKLSSSLSTSSGNFVDFNLSAGCYIVKDTNYTVVVWKSTLTSQVEWEAGIISSQPPDQNNWVSHDQNSTWVDSSLSKRSLAYIIWVELINNPPTITSITATPPGIIISGNNITITPNDLNDLDKNKLSFYCNETGTPTLASSLCSEADANYTYPYSTAKCTYQVTAEKNNQTVYCRALDGAEYSNIVTTTYSSRAINTTAPTIQVLDYNYFGTINTFSVSPDLNGSVRFQCTDSDNNFLNYRVVLNGNTIFDSNVNKEDLNTSNVVFLNGNNTITFYCSDYNNTTSETETFTIYSKQFCVVDEDAGINLTYSDFNSVKAFSTDNNSNYDFNSSASHCVYFTTVSDSAITIQTIYKDPLNTMIQRYFSLGIIDSNSIDVCIPKFQQFYQQILVSSAITPLSLYNPNGECYILGDYTKYAYQNGYSIQAITVNKPYTLYTKSNEQRILLSNLDGSLASVINIDVLNFYRTQSTYSNAGIHISFGPYYNTSTGVYDINLMQILFINDKNNYSSTNFKIYKNDGNLLWQTTETSNPNNIIINWLFGSYGLDQNSILNLVVTGTTSTGATETSNVWFYLSGDSFFNETNNKPPIDSTMAIVFSLGLVLCGLTIVGYRFAFSWLGIIICLAGIGILAFSKPIWQVVFFEAILFIIALYVGLTWKNETSQVA
jgi:hypothetical protein